MLKSANSCNLVSTSAVKPFDNWGLLSQPFLWNENTASADTRIPSAVTA